MFGYTTDVNVKTFESLGQVRSTGHFTSSIPCHEFHAVRRGCRRQVTKCVYCFRSHKKKQVNNTKTNGVKVLSIRLPDTHYCYGIDNWRRLRHSTGIRYHVHNNNFLQRHYIALCAPWYSNTCF